MGGMGSGRRGGRNLTTDYRKLDVRRLHKAGVLRPGYVGSWNWYRDDMLRASILIETGTRDVTLRYTASNDGQRVNHDYAVSLTWTECNYGGERPWFLCPRCLRRVAILYGGPKFVCRHCRELAYPVQRETDNDRIIRRADAIRERLGWKPGILNGEGSRPKGMHWKTYERLLMEYRDLAQVGMAGLMESLEPCNRKLEQLQKRILSWR